jgi:succinoglycan biosynthesis protein ExoO
MKPKISVIIPAYNTEAYVGQAIQSVLDQTEQRFEVIVVDDGSTDQTVEQVKRFTDERIRLYVNDENRGANHARNRALDAASTEWVALLDSDDWYLPERLEKLLHAAERFDADMLADDVYKIPPGSALSAPARTPADQHRVAREAETYFSREMLDSLPKQLSAAELILGNLPGPNHKGLGTVKPLFRRAFLSEKNLWYGEDVQCSQDTVFYTRCLMHGARFILIPEAYYTYRLNREGAISNGDPVEMGKHRYEINSRLLEDERCTEDSALKRALLLRNRALKRWIHYQLFIHAVKIRPRKEVWREVLRNPYGFFVLLLWEDKSFVVRHLKKTIKEILGDVLPV